MLNTIAVRDPNYELDWIDGTHRETCKRYMEAGETCNNDVIVLDQELNNARFATLQIPKWVAVKTIKHLYEDILFDERNNNTLFYNGIQVSFH